MKRVSRTRRGVPRRKALKALPWPGGKSPLRLGPWVASHLPDPEDDRHTYIEPFAGMLGVLLCRAPAYLEMVNDSDQRVVDWWRVIRDQPDELRRLLKRQPMSSKVLHDEALHDVLYHRDPVRRALALTLIMSNANKPSDTWRGRYQPTRYRPTSGQPLGGGDDWIDRLTERLRCVQLYCGDALALLRRTERVEGAVLFVDPPYPSTAGRTRPYAENDLDVPALAATLRRQRGRVALSGYNTDPWSRYFPGWRREQKAVRETLSGGSGSARTTCLWLNYGPDGQRI